MGKYDNLMNIDDPSFDNDNDVVIEPDMATNKSNLKEIPPKPIEIKSNQHENSPLFNMSSFITPNVIGETRERPFSGGNTLDESVWTTLHRDLSTIGDKLLSILWPLRLKMALSQVQFISNDIEDSIDPNGADDYSNETLKKVRDWDLWGPLVINLGFSVIITYLQGSSIDSNDSSGTFSAAFTLIWASLSVLSLNIQLLSPVQQKLDNGNGMSNGIIGLSFFQCISLLSYSMFPITLGGIISIFIKFKWIRLIINLIFLSWSMLCIILILGIVTNCKKRGTVDILPFTSCMCSDSQEEEEEGNESDKRIFLMIYPVFLVFSLFSWFTVIV